MPPAHPSHSSHSALAHDASMTATTVYHWCRSVAVKAQYRSAALIAGLVTSLQPTITSGSSTLRSRPTLTPLKVRSVFLGISFVVLRTSYSPVLARHTQQTVQCDFCCVVSLLVPGCTSGSVGPLPQWRETPANASQASSGAGLGRRQQSCLMIATGDYGELVVTCDPRASPHTCRCSLLGRGDVCNA